MFFTKNSITLLELILSISFLSIILLSALSFEIFGRKELFMVDKRAFALNEASYVLDFVSRDATFGVGLLEPPFGNIVENGNKVGFYILQDTNNDRIVERIGYRKNNSQLIRCELENNICRIIANNIESFDFETIGRCSLAVRVRIGEQNTSERSSYVELSTVVFVPNCSEG